MSDVEYLMINVTRGSDQGVGVLDAMADLAVVEVRKVEGRDDVRLRISEETPVSVKMSCVDGGPWPRGVRHDLKIPSLDARLISRSVKLAVAQLIAERHGRHSDERDEEGEIESLDSLMLFIPYEPRRAGHSLSSQCA